MPAIERVFVVPSIKKARFFMIFISARVGNDCDPSRDDFFAGKRDSRCQRVNKLIDPSDMGPNGLVQTIQRWVSQGREIDTIEVR